MAQNEFIRDSAPDGIHDIVYFNEYKFVAGFAIVGLVETAL